MDKCIFCKSPILSISKEQGYCSPECRELGTETFTKEEKLILEHLDLVDKMRS